jgi:virulence-associated protein VapD
MLELEETRMINYKSYNIETSFGILGDKVGAGKTLMISSLICVNKLAKEFYKISGSNHYTIKTDPVIPKLNTNLLIVPHKLLPQWVETFSKYVKNVSVYKISYNKDIDKIVKTVVQQTLDHWGKENIRTFEEIIAEKINSYDVILIGETMYKRFIKTCLNYQWNRVFIDEADSIKLPKTTYFKFNFLWLITGTPSGLKYKFHNFFESGISINSNLYENFIFKNKDEFIEQSIQLPHPKRLKIKCITPRELSIIKNIIPASVLQMINAGNTEEAIKSLNCNVDTNDNILQVVTKNICNNIKKKEIEFNAEYNAVYPDEHQIEHELKLKSIENQIKKLKEKYDDIKKKIYELNDSYCPVCMGEFTCPTITECCKSCFCFDCLAVSLGELKTNKCPNCRQHISQEGLHIISTDSNLLVNNKINNNIEHELKDKLDVLIDLIEAKPDGSFMIFANYSETFYKIELKLKELGIKYHILKGQANTVKNYIDDFRDKKVNVLMLNAQYFGAGMNLQMTTDLVIYHRFTKEMEEQIIGRAQRLGRKTPLNVYYLIHDNESNNIENNFAFDDQNDIHYTDWLKNNKLNELQNTIDIKEEIIIQNNIKINNSEELIVSKNKKIIVIDNDNNLENLDNFEIIN